MTGRFTTAVRRGLYFVAGRLVDEAFADSRQKLVAYLAVGIEPLFAAAFDGARVGGRPIFDIDGSSSG